jgi:hypothetical protein
MQKWQNVEKDCNQIGRVKRVLAMAEGKRKYRQPRPVLGGQTGDIET